MPHQQHTQHHTPDNSSPVILVMPLGTPLTNPERLSLWRFKQALIKDNQTSHRAYWPSLEVLS